MCTLAHIISQVSLLLCQQVGGCPHWLRHVLQIQCLPFDNLGSTHSRRSRRTRSRALMPTSSRESGMLSSCASSSVHICVAGHYTSSYPWHDFSQLNHPIFFSKKEASFCHTREHFVAVELEVQAQRCSRLSSL